jgi:GAF domain-containing protein
VTAPAVFANDSQAGRRASLGEELAWLLALLPGESRGHEPDGTHDDRVAAIVATALLALPAERSDEAITRAMAAVGLQRRVDRVFYYRLDEAVGEVVLTHEWHAPEVRPLRGAPKFVQMALDVLPPPVLARLRGGDMLCLPRTRQLLGAPVDALVSPEGDRAVALAPVVVGGALIGVAGFAANCGSTWTDGDLDLLRVVAQGVARAVDGRRTNEALRASEDRFRAMCDASPPRRSGSSSPARRASAVTSTPRCSGSPT